MIRTKEQIRADLEQEIQLFLDYTLRDTKISGVKYIKIEFKTKAGDKHTAKLTP